MYAIDNLQDLARRPLEAADRLRDALTPELLNAHPGGHDNSVAWLLWHAGREIDVQLADLAGHEQVWTVEGFDDRFGLDLDPEDMGYGHTPEQARAVQVSDGSLLLDYLRAVTEAQVDYLETLVEEDLAQIVDRSWDPPVTRAARLISISVDAAEHVAQAAYIAGLPNPSF